ncbi:MAG: discoidin domain-containing protein [Candidatus Brocadiia bacterium]
MRAVPIAIFLAAALGAGAGQRPQAEPPQSFRQAVEADWLLQDRVRPMRQAPRPTTRDDAMGAVDGKKTGKWAFHTGEDKPPWWHVDLGHKVAIDRVVVYNRCDGGTAARTRHIQLLLSDDGKSWATAYEHDGSVFHGATGGPPLTIPLEGREARFVRLQIPSGWFHLDEVEVYPVGEPETNIALGQPADQSSTSQWSTFHTAPSGEADHPIGLVVERGRKLAAHLLAADAPVQQLVRDLEAVAARAEALPEDASPADRKTLYLEARWAVRRLALANPLLDFEAIFFTKRVPSSYSHMSDQYYGWWSRPGGGLFLLRGFRGGEPQVEDITPDLPEGSYLRPDLSYDARRVLFAYCRYYPQVRGLRNKVDKKAIPEDAFYHVYEMNVDGSGLRRLTRGHYDDFDARYLPDGRIVFLSTRRGQFVLCGAESAAATVENPHLPNSYVRCGGGNSRPVAIYTLHVMEPDGAGLRAISPFENFEWTPSVAHDGRVLYARWDYVDRHNMPFMSLWATRPDGSSPSLVYGNFTRSPHCIFEARAVPGSRKIMFTASGHHAITAGSICLLDPARGTEGEPPITRLTPEVCFPEIEGWPATYYAHPYPLSETAYLVSWSPHPIRRQGRHNNANDLGLYLADAFGNLELLYRDPDISSAYPIPLEPRPRPQSVAPVAQGGGEGRFLLLDVYRGLDGIPRGAVERLRLVAVPAKTQPQMNRPAIGATRDDPGKCVLGTVPVRPDGSAHFRAPAGVILFFQALDADGMAVQSMRTVTCVQPGQTLSCIGCHESRAEAPPNAFARAASRPPSPITPGPEGSWPLRYDRLVQPVLDEHCVRCHRPEGKAKAVAKLDLRPGKSYAALAGYATAPIPIELRWSNPGRAPGRNEPVPVATETSSLSLHAHVKRRYGEGHSVVGACAARMNPVIALLRKGHHDVELGGEDLERLVTWMDTYGQRQGHFSDDQARRLEALRRRMAPLLAERH